ncbi:hypothetical protein PMAYCL1PPCAC_15285, partial [Pristionchus mayeri]
SVTGLILNALLLYAIRRFSGANLGSYKYLLTIFSLVDLFLIVLHVTVQPMWYKKQNISTFPKIIDQNLFEKVTTMYVGFQSVPFTLLSIHFLYRYWSVRRPHLIPLFSNKSFVVFLASLTVGELFSWHFLCLYTSSGHDASNATAAVVAKYESIYGKHIENAWIVMDNWPDGTFDVTLFTITVLMDVIMLTNLVVASSFAILTFMHIRQSYKTAARASELQQKLLLALCAQAAIPCLFVYTPFLFCINAPFVGIPGAWIPDISAPLMSFFPAWDAAIILLLFTDYR